MVEVTIKTDFNENGAADGIERRLPPCGLAFVVCVTSRDEGEAYQGSGSLVGGLGMDMCESAALLGEMTARALKDMADGQEGPRKLLFAAYLESFLAEIDTEGEENMCGVKD